MVLVMEMDYLDHFIADYNIKPLSEYFDEVDDESVPLTRFLYLESLVDDFCEEMADEQGLFVIEKPDVFTEEDEEREWETEKAREKFIFDLAENLMQFVDSTPYVFTDNVGTYYIADEWTW
jgi:hypothetical protein